MKRIGTLLLLGLVIVFGYVAWNYLHYRSVNAVSNAAFVRTDSLATLGFKFGGKLVQMTRREGEAFKQGDLLARLDTVDDVLAMRKLDYATAAAESALHALQSRYDRLSQTLTLQNELAANGVESARKQAQAAQSTVAQLKARHEQAQRDLDRLRSLHTKHLIDTHSVEEAQLKATTLRQQLESAKLQYHSAEIALDNARKNARLAEVNLKQLTELHDQIDAQHAQVAAMKAQHAMLMQKIADSNLTAPYDGEIAKKFTAAGSILGKGSPVYAVVDPNDVHIEVLLEEKKLHGIAPGNAVEIHIDALPGKTFSGHVERILPTSASTFSLVPRDIASGEFTKLAQRFVVRVTLDTHEGLRPGMSAEVAIARR